MESASVLVLVLSFVSATEAFRQVKEIAEIEIHDVTRRDISDSADHPETLAFRLELPKRHVLLHLERRDSLNGHAPVFTSNEDGNIEEIEIGKRDYMAYQDVDKRAAVTVTVEHTSDGRVRRSLAGTFDIDQDGTEYLIEVLPAVEDRRRSATDAVRHIVIKRAAKPSFLDEELLGNYEIVKRSDDKTIVKRAGKTRYTVELLAVVDYSTYNYWKDKTVEYFHQVVNGIDLLYANINERDFEIVVRLAGFYIAKTARDSPWTDGSSSIQRSNPRDIVDASKALDDVVKWQKTKSGLPTHDHTMLFTIMDIHHKGNLGTAGLAYTSAICTYQSASVVETHGGFQAMNTGAHELGHSLSAHHDGEASNKCVPKDQFIMTATGGEVNDKTKINPYHFSSCSITYFRNHLKTLNPNCLSNSATHAGATQFNKDTSNAPGQLYDANAQCQQIYGSHASMCQNKLSQLCYHLWCSVGNSCKTWNAPAAKGTTCGNQKWCVKGSCVSDSKAPKADETCLFGDQRTISITGVGTVRCEDYISNKPSSCYTQGIRDSCCGSCNNIADKKHPTCMYGDKANGCNLAACRVPSNKPICCKTCG